MAKKNSMQWFIDIHNKSQPNDKKRISPVKSYRNAFSHGTKADKKIKYCEECRCCWEHTEKYKKTLYYEDFPNRGKEFKRCPKHRER